MYNVDKYFSSLTPYRQVPSIPLAEFLPENQEKFFRYNGSLTMPPCSENVVVRNIAPHYVTSILIIFQWTVLAKPKILLVEQLVLFRSVKDEEGGRLGGYDYWCEERQCQSSQEQEDHPADGLEAGGGWDRGEEERKIKLFISLIWLMNLTRL